MARCDRCDGSGQGSGGYNGECGYCDGTGQGTCDACGYPSHRESPADCSKHHGQNNSSRKEEFMTTAFTPKHFPRTRLASGRVLSDSQQYQYDVLRSVGGKLIKGKDAWYRADTAEKIYGLNLIAMWKLVDLGLVECTDDEPTRGYLFLLTALTKDVPGPRYSLANHIVKPKGIPLS